MPPFPLSHFAGSYAEARAKFRDAAALAGFAVESHDHPLKGPTGEDLALDVVAICPPGGPVVPCEAEKVFVTMSGTHGPEGFMGSAAQVGWLAEGRWRDLPAGTAAVLLHAVNPHGFANVRRTTEDNVDLNRNFRDFSQPAPAKPAYDELAESICPKVWTPTAVAAADAVLDGYAAKHGKAALERAVMGGQFSHPQGLFYGGAKPTWSRERILSVLRAHARRAKHVAVIDFHTGLGPFGHGACYVIGAAESPAVTQGKKLWGEDAVVFEKAHDGYNLPGLARELSHAAFYGVTLECGTHPVDEVLRALRADNWLQHHGDEASPQGRAIKAEVKRVLYPEDSVEWKTRVYARAMDVWSRGLTGLAAL